MENKLKNYVEEIKHRDDIIAKIHGGLKISPDERQWLMTHKLYNRFYGYPYLNTDIIHLEKNVVYSVQVKIESKKYPDRIIPFFTAPCGKGEIYNNDIVFDNRGKPYTNKKVKMFGCLIDSNNTETYFQYKSQLGLLEVSYECQYFDEHQKLTIRKNSLTGDPSYAMLKEQVASDKIIYYCKSPTNKDFNSLVFSVKWKKHIYKTENDEY